MNQEASIVATEDLSQELQRALALHFGAPRPIRRLRRRRSNYASSYRIENLELQLEDGARLSLVFKDMSAASLLREAREVRPEFLYSPQREIDAYRVLLDPRQLGTAICYGSSQRPELKRYWLFLERVKGPLLWQVGRLESWKLAARWLARLHNRFSTTQPHPPGLPTCLLRYDRPYYERWINRASRFLSHPGALRKGRLLRQFERLAGNFQPVTARLLSLDQTLIHGEFYPSNVILRGRGTEKRVCPIDWEVAAVGPGLMDVAALTSGSWRAEQRNALIEDYCAELERCDGCSLSRQEILESVDYCQLHLAVQWLGWARDWTPPKAHGQNWLSEAVRLAQKLGLIA